MFFQRFLRLSAFGAIFCGLVGTTAKASLINWTIASARSAITVTAQVTDGTNVLAELQEQSPGSTIGAAEGTILSNVNFVAGRPGIAVAALALELPAAHGGRARHAVRPGTRRLRDRGNRFHRRAEKNAGPAGDGHRRTGAGGQVLKHSICDRNGASPVQSQTGSAGATARPPVLFSLKHRRLG